MKRGRPSQWVSLGILADVIGLTSESIRRRRLAGILQKDHHYVESPAFKQVVRRWHLQRCIETVLTLSPEESAAMIAEHRASQEVA